MPSSASFESRSRGGDTPRKNAAQHPNYPQLSRKFVARRISEGETGRLKEELKCQACGKGYKHVSSLAKHLWEHTPEWNVTNKLLISKHQQVQLLEAASILVSMNEEDSEEGEDDDLSDKTSSSETPSTNESSVEPKDLSDDYIDQNTKDTLVKSLELDYENAIDEKNDIAVFSPETARETPILGGKPISKPMHRSRRRASTFSSSYGSAGRLDSLAQIASPLSESVIAKDNTPNPPWRRRFPSTYQSAVGSIPRHPRHDSQAHADVFDDDGLQEPNEDDERDAEIDRIDEGKESSGVFGDLEV